MDPDKPLNIASAAKAIAELSRATVGQKKWQAEVREKAAALGLEVLTKPASPDAIEAFLARISVP